MKSLFVHTTGEDNQMSLTFRRMLKTTVDDGTEQLWFEQKVSEAGAVDGNVGTLHLLLAYRGLALRGSLWLLIFFIVEQLVVNIILCHCVCLWGDGKGWKMFYLFNSFICSCIIYKHSLLGLQELGGCSPAVVAILYARFLHNTI